MSQFKAPIASTFKTALASPFKWYGKKTPVVWCAVQTAAGIRTSGIVALDISGNIVWSYIGANNDYQLDGTSVFGKALALSHDSSSLFMATNGYFFTGADAGKVFVFDAQSGSITTKVSVGRDIYGVEGTDDGGFVCCGSDSSGVYKVWRYDNTYSQSWVVSPTPTLILQLTPTTSGDFIGLYANSTGTTELEKFRGSDGVSLATYDAWGHAYSISATSNGAYVPVVGKPQFNREGTNVLDSLTGDTPFGANITAWFVRAEGTNFYVSDITSNRVVEQFTTTSSPATVDWTHTVTGADTNSNWGIDIHPNGKFGSADGGIFATYEKTGLRSFVTFISVDAGDASVTEEWTTELTDVEGSKVYYVNGLVSQPHINIRP